MKTSELHVGMKVRHPQHGMGIVKTITESTADIRFDDGTRTVAPETSDLVAEEARVSVGGRDVPLAQFIEKTTRAVLTELGVGTPGEVVEQLGGRWRGGRLMLHPSDASLQAKEIPLDVFFHKVVMLRNNLRVSSRRSTATRSSPMPRRWSSSNTSHDRTVR